MWERNAADDTFGFGVVFSDETLGGIAHADPVIHAPMERGVRALGRHRRALPGRGASPAAGTASRRWAASDCSQILQRRCADLGVDVRFRTAAPDVARAVPPTTTSSSRRTALNSRVRTTYADPFRPTLDVRDCRYMWLGTDKVFDAFTFDIRETPHGVMQMHGYPFDAHGSTFIVEMNDDVWRAAGFDALPPRRLAPGESDEASDRRRSASSSPTCSTDTRCSANNSRWVSFTTVRNERWRHGNVVLLGDAAHTAHFSIGSGTKLAMEDALSLAACLHE